MALGVGATYLVETASLAVLHYLAKTHWIEECTRKVLSQAAIAAGACAIELFTFYGTARATLPYAKFAGSFTIGATVSLFTTLKSVKTFMAFSNTL
jgi:hypothetical protein